MTVKFRHHGNFQTTERFLNAVRRKDYRRTINEFANRGKLQLASATPIDSSLTANSWDYEVKIYQGGFKIIWTNSNLVDGIPVAILIQYGHGTRNGSFIQGRDYINPTMQPIFDQIAESLWKEVTNL